MRTPGRGLSTEAGQWDTKTRYRWLLLRNRCRHQARYFSGGAPTKTSWVFGPAPLSPTRLPRYSLTLPSTSSAAPRGDCSGQIPRSSSASQQNRLTWYARRPTWGSLSWAAVRSSGRCIRRALLTTMYCRSTQSPSVLVGNCLATARERILSWCAACPPALERLSPITGFRASGSKGGETHAVHATAALRRGRLLDARTRSYQSRDGGLRCVCGRT